MYTIQSICRGKMNVAIVSHREQTYSRFNCGFQCGTFLFEMKVRRGADPMRSQLHKYRQVFFFLLKETERKTEIYIKFFILIQILSILMPGSSWTKVFTGSTTMSHFTLELQASQNIQKQLNCHNFYALTRNLTSTVSNYTLLHLFIICAFIYWVLLHTTII